MSIGFIGAGNMAVPIIEGAIKSGVFKAEDIVIDSNRSRAADLHARLGVTLQNGLISLIRACDMLVIAVKPNVVSKVLKEAGSELKGKAIISIAAGWSTEALINAAPGARVVRVMPNTPAMVGEGMSAMSKAHTLTNEEAELTERLFSSFGRAVWVEEYMMEAVIGVSGSGPAYAFMFIEAMADGGVMKGLPRKAAQELAAQTLLGAAKMVLESGMHPGALKDMVCSPGGTTIAAVRALEANGFRGAVMDAVAASADKAEAMKG
ncbi:MAG: pyrroline-5-carboxylate reductase [Clostridia bacterium]|nr:pyrroline-5-carboxylate reductase [Clostridia bacterium]